MKAVIYISIFALVTGCADQASISRWNDMWVDIALRHKFEKYSCAHSLEGYSKDPPAFSHRKQPATEQVVVKAQDTEQEARKQFAQRNEDSIRALSARMDVIQDAVKANAATSNKNQDLVVQQINALKAQQAQMQQPSSRLPER